MNRSIMFSASILNAQRGQPRAVCSSTLPQSRQVLVLIAFGPLRVNHIEHDPADLLLYWSKKFTIV
jgi:hypothetical protein